MDINEHLAIFLEISTQFETILASQPRLYLNIVGTLVDAEYLLLTDLEACCGVNTSLTWTLMTWLEIELTENIDAADRENILELIYVAVLGLQRELESVGGDDDLEIFQPIE